MNFKTTYILFGALLAILVIFGVALYQYDDSPGEQSSYVLATLHDKPTPLPKDDTDPATPDRRTPPEKIVFARDPDPKRGKTPEPGAMRAARLAVNALLRQFYDAR